MQREVMSVREVTEALDSALYKYKKNLLNLVKVNTEAYVWCKWLTEKCWNVKLNEFGFLHAYHFPFERLCAGILQRKNWLTQKFALAAKLGCL